MALIFDVRFKSGLVRYFSFTLIIPSVEWPSFLFLSCSFNRHW